MSEMGSHDPFGHLKHKLWPKEGAGSQIGNLTLDHQKSRIARIPLRVGGVQHTIENLSIRATTLLETSSQSKVYIKNYVPPKSRESQL
jgi:hypothetical protein